MMWPVEEFYNGSNDLVMEELRLAAIFQERGREDLAHCVLDGRKVQRFFFGLGPDNAFLNEKTFTELFVGLRQAFGSGDEVWEKWKCKALDRWKDDELL